MKRFSSGLFVVALLLSVFGVAGCGGSTPLETTTTMEIPVGWNIYEGENFTLALPESFEGGKPSEAEAKALSEKITTLNPSLAEALRSAGATSIGYEFLALGEMLDDGTFPVVHAMREAVGSVSMSKYLEALSAQLDNLGLQFEVVESDDNSTHLTSLNPAWEGAEQMWYQHILLLKHEGYVYGFNYGATEGNKHTVDDIFESSRRTIVFE